MFSKVIKFKDFSGEEQIQEFYFHIGKAEFLQMGVAHIQGRLERIKNTNDGAGVLAEVRELVHMAAGMRSDDGRRFLKTDEAKSALFDSNAYDELLFELCTDAESAAEFVNKLFPQEMLKEMSKHIVQETTLAPTKVVDGTSVSIDERHEKMKMRDAQLQAEDNRPAWVKEGRKPTKAELMSMPREEMFEAFRRHPELSSEKI